MSTTVSIRGATARDAAAIAEIYNEAIRSTTATFDTEPKSADERLRWLQTHDDRNPVLVAEIDGHVVGWAALTKWSDRPAYDQTAESSFYVAERFRDRGIGRALKERLIEAARSLGFHTILARVAEESGASIHINESFGFRHVGTMKEVGLKFGRRLDVHLLQLMLDEPAAAGAGKTAATAGVVPHETATTNIAATIVESALALFQANKGWVEKAVTQLPDEKLHVALDRNTNSIAAIMKHIAGNLLSRWTDFLTTDGEKPWRNRDDEFVDSFTNRAEVLDCWERGWSCLFDALRTLTPHDLSKIVTIRGEPHSVPLAIHRSLAHCGYHVGQIILVARILAGERWETITIPRGGSASYNQKAWGKANYEQSALNPK